MKWNNEENEKPSSADVRTAQRQGFSTLAAAFGGEAEDRETEEREKIDFKMVTFALAGKDYGIDIMKVKEIAKYGNFTYVPNTPPFVTGVYNLRGDIISVIDLRKMFNLPVPEKAEGEAQDGLILRLENNLIGVVVDHIDRVVGIASTNIQPPHPIFADINIKYISGVVEQEGRLYIILDVERIFQREEEKNEPAAVRLTTAQPEPAAQPSATTPSPPASETEFDFVRESLSTFDVFHVTEINEQWARERFEEWRSSRKTAGKPIQLSSHEEARDFVKSFTSECTGTFWDENYLEKVEKVLPEVNVGTVHVWNPGCGQGFESYSLAVLLKRHYPDKQIKIWASDRDLLSISTAPNLVFPRNSIPDYYADFIVEGTNGMSFGQEVKDAILFEYHDVLHPNAIPEVDIILSRDVLSFLKESDQKQVLSQFHEKVKSSGVIIPGKHELLDTLDGWERVKSGLTAFRKA